MKKLIAKLPLSGNANILVYEKGGWCSLFFGSGYDRTYLGSESKKFIFNQIINNLSDKKSITVGERECFELILLENTSVSVCVTTDSPHKMFMIFNEINTTLEHNLTESDLNNWQMILKSSGISAIFRMIGLLCCNLPIEVKQSGTEYRKFTELLDTVLIKHKPEAIGLKLDVEGWAYVSELIVSMRKSGQWMDLRMLERAVKSKKQFVFNEDRSKIRALQAIK